MPLDVAILGGHGKVARRLTRLLVARGDRVRGIIRNPDHAADLVADGAEPVVCDAERATDEQLAQAIIGADAVVFAAGAGPGSGPERKITVDRDAAIKLVHAARASHVDVYVMISSIGAEDPPQDDDVFSVYLRAKADADRALAESDLDWTIVRPGFLTDERGDSRVRIEPEPLRGEIPRDDVAAVLDEVLHHEPRVAQQVLYAIDGDQPVAIALAKAVAAPARS